MLINTLISFSFYARCFAKTVSLTQLLPFGSKLPKPVFEHYFTINQVKLIII